MMRFIDVIYPEHSAAGKLSNLETDPSMPDFRIMEGLRVLRDWIQESIYASDRAKVADILQLFLTASVSLLVTLRTQLLMTSTTGRRSLRCSQVHIPLQANWPCIS
jgi:hypothetical protein